MNRAVTTGDLSAVLTEYNTLRDEILGYQRDSMHILAFTGVLAAFSFGYALKAQDALFFFILNLLLVAPIHLQVQRLRSTYRIGRYIQTFIEGPETGLYYETRWMRLKRKHPRHEQLFTFKFAVTAPIILLQFASTFLMIHCFTDSRLMLSLLSGISLGVLAYGVYLIRKSDHIEDLSEWFQEIRHDEMQDQLRHSVQTRP